MNRKIKPIIYIFCEGKTEKSYFIKLGRILNNNFKIVLENLGGGGKIKDNPEKLKGKIRKRLKNDKNSLVYKKVFIVFDLDIFDKNKLQNTQNILNNYELIYNNMCFEYWILSHFKKYDLGRGKSEYLDKIKIHLPDLSNDKFTGRTDFDWLTKEKVKEAIKSVKDVNTKSSGNLKDRDPYSNVYEIIEFLGN